MKEYNNEISVEMRRIEDLLVNDQYVEDIAQSLRFSQCLCGMLVHVGVTVFE